MRNIKISGARTHNLKNISLEIPAEKITVISGISGSGKSSLAFDTIFAEGQRRYVENLSSYARQVIGVIEKPDVDSIEGIPPAISIDQKSVARSPRSTVGTLTEAYDYLRLLFARFGKVYCPKCKCEIFAGESHEIIQKALGVLNDYDHLKLEKLKVLSPIISNVKGQHTNLIKRLAKSQFSSFRIDNSFYNVTELNTLKLKPTIAHTLEAVVFDFENHGKQLKEETCKKFEKAVRSGLDLSDGIVTVLFNDEQRIFSKLPYCEKCNIHFPQIQPRLFSFNSPYGACSMCQGLGIIKKVSPRKVLPNGNLTVAEGAVRPWSRLSGQNGYLMKSLIEVAKINGFNLATPVRELSRENLSVLLYGKDEFEGVIPNLERKYRETDSDYLRQEIEQYMVESECTLCHGKRLNEFAESVRVLDKKISDLADMEADELTRYLKQNIKKFPKESQQVVSELIRRLKNLTLVGLDYLTLNRSSESLSGGEAQRIRLGVQFDSFLSGVLYVLDEPTISLHASDTEKLINSFNRLKAEGNTLVVVEHDKAIILNSDYVFDIGPGAGKCGGEIIAQGTPKEIVKNPFSITGKYLSGKREIKSSKVKRKASSQAIKIIGATHNNLKNISVEIPLKLFICITGVSGSGKSSLVYDILAKSVAHELHRAQDKPGAHKSILGIEYLDKIIKIDQTPIGRTPRSNLATYTGIFTPMRELFADTPSSCLKGFLASQFSFNLQGGRCEVCRGDGMIKVEMFFMNDVYVPCEECSGRRYNSETLEIKYQGKSISDVLSMSVDEAAEFFKDVPELSEKIKVLQRVGLGYLPIGQSATTLSGGEAQRIKLATELARPSTGKTIYILDEPTTGLHFEDIGKLLNVLQELVDRGNTVLVIEHNLDVIKSADYVIDMGPLGGKKGGEIIATGTPEQIAKNPKSLTGKFLKEEL